MDRRYAGGYFSIEQFLSGHTAKGIVLAVLAILFALLGVKWRVIKSWFPQLLSAVERTVGNRLYRRAIHFLLVAVILLSIGTKVYELYRTKQQDKGKNSPMPTVPVNSDLSK